MGSFISLIVICLSLAIISVKTGISGHVLRFLGYDLKCPFCGSEDIHESKIFAGTKKTSSGQSQDVYTLKYDCSSCGKHWEKENHGDGLLYWYISRFDKKNIKRSSNNRLDV